ncbi:DUF1842 domain-containing protein [Shewanella sp. YLB-07]|uniref:DUF1842 domain-containing protein n=1 Tax=Shewanella sp. YLB-07 TaxID=2601268 RepID=UPI001883907F|nr:DUF1842 domain-containing protein [Shewanella sp. YLB-07]
MEYSKVNATEGVLVQKMVLSNGLVGSPVLVLNLYEDTETYHFVGIGHITQTTMPLTDIRSQVTGAIVPLIVSGGPTPLYNGTGLSFPVMPFYHQIEDLEFNFQLGVAKGADGTGRFRFLNPATGEWTEVANCNVVVEQTSQVDTQAA